MDVPIGDAREVEPQDDASGEEILLPLSGKEKRILELYDRLLKLEFELALIKAHQYVTIGMALAYIFSRAIWYWYLIGH
jgi:hypothetical protein